MNQTPCQQYHQNFCFGFWVEDSMQIPFISPAYSLHVKQQIHSLKKRKEKADPIPIFSGSASVQITFPYVC